jgi:hypothetical protein
MKYNEPESPIINPDDTQAEWCDAFTPLCATDTDPAAHRWKLGLKPDNDIQEVCEDCGALVDEDSVRVHLKVGGAP